MQESSIHNPVHVENAHPQNPLPTTGDNFTFATGLDGVADPMSLLTAIDFLDDCTVALAAFEQELERTGTP